MTNDQQEMMFDAFDAITAFESAVTAQVLAISAAVYNSRANVSRDPAVIAARLELRPARKQLEQMLGLR